MGQMKFEEALSRLEEIVKGLEKGDLPLDKAMASFEEGVALSKVCMKFLEDADRKVEVLLQGQNGETKTEPFQITDAQE